MSLRPRFNHSGSVLRIVTLLTAAMLTPSIAHCQSSDTIAISGTFQMLSANGNLSSDLAGVFAHGLDHTWTLTLHGVTYEYDYGYTEWGNPDLDGGYDERYVTRAHATSFELEFFGPDGVTLNEVVSGQLAGGGLTNGAVVELVNGDYMDQQFWWESGPYSSFSLSLSPTNFEHGVVFSCYAFRYELAFTPEHQTFKPQRLTGVQGWIDDNRMGNDGEIQTYEQVVDIGSDVPPAIVPRLRIFDGSVVEGNSGTKRLDLTVTLSGSSSQQITVQYRTVNGTAVATSDYKATSGTVTFLPGEIRKTISVSVVGDRKREPNESFTVDLSNPSGANFLDSAATATIANDD